MSSVTISEKIKKQEIIIAVLVGFLIVFGVCAGMGTFTSGFHPVDDYEYLGWTYDRQNGLSFFELLKCNILTGGVRFRPLHMFLRTLMNELYGTNLLLHSLTKAVNGSIALVCLYFVARKDVFFGCGKPVSAVFSYVCCIGYQTCTWWKLGTHDIDGVMLFSIGFLFAESYTADHRKKHMILSIVFFVLMVLEKENMMLLLPFAGLYTLFFDIKTDRKSNGLDKISPGYVLGMIRSRMTYYFILVLICLSEVAACKLLIDWSYGEMVTGDFLPDIDAWKEAVSGDLKWFIIFGTVFTGVLLTFYDDLKTLRAEIILPFVLVIPQIIIFAGVGISERYILPASIGYAYLFVIIALGSGVLRGYRKWIYVSALVLLLLAHTRAMLREADYFRFRGNGFQSTMDYILEVSKDNPDANICIAFDYFESNKTIEYYVRLYSEDRLYFYHNYDAAPEGYEIDRDCWGTHQSDSGNASELAEKMDIYVAYNSDDRHYSFEPKVDLSDFTLKQYGTVNIFVRNGSGIKPTDANIKPLMINF